MKIKTITVQRVKNLGNNADKVIGICEPTGINYAKLWLNKLSDWGYETRMISNSKLPIYRSELMGKEGNSDAKTDDKEGTS